MKVGFNTCVIQFRAPQVISERKRSIYNFLRGQTSLSLFGLHGVD
jgi:hypothetical protein